MKNTSILSLKSWTAKIHPPLPRTPRQSEQLHALLTSSFRRQLDQQFPPIPSTTNTESDTRPGSSDGQQHSAQHTSAHSADRHMKTILDHPLFNLVPSKNLSCAEDKSTDTQLNGNRRLVEEPMTLFDEMVALGTADHHTVHQCLNSQLALIGASSEEPVHERMKRSGAGSRAVAWFWAADSESRKQLFRCRRTIASVMKFMVAENLQRVVITWLKLFQKLDVGGGSGQISLLEARTFQHHLLAELVAAEISYGRGIESGLAYYTLACELLSPSNESMLLIEKESPLRSTGFNLARWIVENGHSPEVKAIPVDLFDEFSRVAHRWSRRPHFWAASIQLYHPTQPTAQPALEYVKQQSSSNHQLWKAPRREGILGLCLEAAQLSLVQEKYGDATWLTKYAKELLSDEQQTKEQASARPDNQPSTSHEDLLNRLDLALG